MFILMQEMQINGKNDYGQNSGIFNSESGHNNTLSVAAQILIELCSE